MHSRFLQVRLRAEARRRGRPIYLYESRADAREFVVESDSPTTGHAEIPARVVDPESVVSEESPVNRTPNGKDDMVSNTGVAHTVPPTRPS